MTTHDITPGDVTYRPTAAAWSPLVAALGFLVFYLAVSPVAGSLASGALPLPDAPGAEVRDWYSDNQLAAVTGGVLQLLSVACLAGFAILFRWRAAVAGHAAAASRASRWGMAAVALMALSSLLTWVLAALAPEASTSTVSGLRTAGFVAGGTAHVVALGLFVLLSSRIPGTTRPIRVLAYVAVVPAVLSLSSLVVFEGAAFILLGRLLCMVWVVSAAVSALRHRTVSA
jgi:hypothetical protein